VSETTASAAQSETSAPSLVESGSRSAELDDGLAVLDAAGNALSAAERGDWSEAGLNAGLAGLDSLGAIIDPFGALFTSGVAWAMEHVEPLSDILDSVAGDPGQITAMAATWANICARLSETADLHADYVQADLASVSGPAVATYQAYARREAELLRRLATSTRSVGESLQTAGAVVGAVRGVVRDLISSVVGGILSAALKAVASGGTALPWAIAEIADKVRRCVSRVADWLRRLVDAVNRLTRLLQSARDGLENLARVLRSVRRWADESGVAESVIFDSGIDAGPGTVSLNPERFARHMWWSARKNAATNAESTDERLRENQV
jgi:hypothetical protein